jgi:microcystin-dependent protein
MNSFIGEIRLFAFDYAPQYWAVCDGHLVPISQYSTLYALIGTTFGGDGVSNFALPNLVGQTPYHADATYTRGTQIGSEGVALTETQIPAHTHNLMGADDNTSLQKNPDNAMPAKSDQGYAKTLNQPGQLFLHNQALRNGGSGAPHENRQPFLVMNYCINLEGGDFPPPQ